MQNFFNSILAVAMIIVMSMSLTACGNKDVSFDTVETARKQAKENAEFNGKSWRSQDKNNVSMSLISRGDSSQTPSCPQGDGWATIDLIDQNNSARKIVLKCSTVSDSIGCRESQDFKGSPYANEDGRCQLVSKVPHPLPKIAQ